MSKHLALMKTMLYGSSDQEPNSDIAVAQLAQELYNCNMLLLLVQNLPKIDFEVKLPVFVLAFQKYLTMIYFLALFVFCT